MSWIFANYYVEYRNENSQLSERTSRKQFAVSKKLLYTSSRPKAILPQISVNGDVHDQSQTPQLFGSLCRCLFVLPQKQVFAAMHCYLKYIEWNNLYSKLIRFHNEKTSKSDTGLGSLQTTLTLWHWPIVFFRDWKDRKWKSVNLLCCFWMTITYRILNRLPQDKVLWNPC